MGKGKSKRLLRDNVLRGYATTSTPRVSKTDDAADAPPQAQPNAVACAITVDRGSPLRIRLELSVEGEGGERRGERSDAGAVPSPAATPVAPAPPSAVPTTPHPPATPQAINYKGSHPQTRGGGRGGAASAVASSPLEPCRLVFSSSAPSPARLDLAMAATDAPATQAAGHAPSVADAAPPEAPPVAAPVAVAIATDVCGDADEIGDEVFGLDIEISDACDNRRGAPTDSAEPRAGSSSGGAGSSRGGSASHAPSRPVPICSAGCAGSSSSGQEEAMGRSSSPLDSIGGSWGNACHRLAASAPAELTSRGAWPGLSPRGEGGRAARSSSLHEEAPVEAEEVEGEEEEGVMCAICHGNIQPNEVALVRGCDHAFCSLCILNWATQKARCPLCLENFTHLWLYRRIDGTYNDYLFEESVDLLHCAVWFKKAVSAEYAARTAGPEDDEDDYHDHLQWMYGGAREAAEEHEYYDEMQEGLERMRGGRQKAFGQRKWGNGGFVAGGGNRLAARVPAAPEPSSSKAVATPRYSKKGFAAGSNCADAGGAPCGPAGSSGGGKRAADRKAEKQALKEAQKEKRRSWAAAA